MGLSVGSFLRHISRNTEVYILYKPKFSILFSTQVDQTRSRCLSGVMVKAIDCRIVVSEFVPKSPYYVHFRTSTLGNGMNSFILPVMC